MVIVSQDKDTIINFDNVESVDIVADLNGTGEVPYKINYETSSTREELGKYKTEERAKEVLQGIIQCYKNTNYEYENCWCLRNLVYEMPEE